MYKHQAGRTPALQQNWQSFEKSKKNQVKHNKHPVSPPMNSHVRLLVGLSLCRSVNRPVGLSICRSVTISLEGENLHALLEHVYALF